MAATALGAAFYYLADSTKALTKEEAYHADLSKQVADGFGKESAGAAILFDKLEKLNPKSAEAKTVRDEINTTYKAYLPNQLTEASNNDEIARSQDAVNAALMTKIKLQVREAEMTKVYAQQQTVLIEAADLFGKKAKITSSETQKAIAVIQDAIGSVGEETRQQLFLATNDFDALARELGKVAGVGADVTATINKIIAADLSHEFLGAAGVVALTEDKIKSLLAFMDEVPESATNAGAAIGNTGSGMGGQAIAAAGSIDALNEQLSKLRDQFNAVSSASERMSLGQDIAELETTIERVTAQGAPLDSFIVKTQDISAALTDMGSVAQRSMRDASQLAADAAASFTAAEPAILTFAESLQAAMGEEAFSKMKAGIDQLKGLLVDFAASTAEAIGFAIGKGESAADAFKQAIGEFVQQATKMAGMAMLNIAATPGMGPAAIPFLVGGLALLGLSGILKGVEASNDAKLQAAKDAGSMPSLSSQAQTGGLTGLSVTESDPFAGRTIILNVDGREVEAAVTTRQNERERLKGN